MVPPAQNPDSPPDRGVPVPLVDVGTQDLGLPAGKAEDAGLAWDMQPFMDVVGFEGMASDRQIVPPPMVKAALQEGIAGNYPPTLKTLRLMPYALGMSDSDRVRFFLELTSPRRNPDPFLVLYLVMGLKPLDFKAPEVVTRVADALHEFDSESEEFQEVVLPLARVAMIRAFEYGAPWLASAVLDDLQEGINGAEGRASLDAWHFPAAGHPAADLATALRGQSGGAGQAAALVQLAKTSNLAYDMLIAHLGNLIGAEGRGVLNIGFREAMEGIAGGIMHRGQGGSLGAGETLLWSAWLYPTTNPEITARARHMDETDLGEMEVHHLEMVRSVLTRAGLPALDPAWQEAMEEDDRPLGTEIIKEALAATEVPFPLLGIHRRGVIVGLDAMLDRSLGQAIEARRQSGIVPPMPRQVASAMAGLFLAAGGYGMQEAAESLSRQMGVALSLGWTWIDPEPPAEEE